MNQIYITGLIKQKAKKDLVKKVTLFTLDKLMPRKRNLVIDFSFGDIAGAEGYCLSISNNEYEIEMDKNLEGDDLITCIIHELIHVKQYARKELVDCEDGTFKWKGTEWNDNSNEPWEDEAYTGQETMLELYKLTQ